MQISRAVLVPGNLEVMDMTLSSVNVAENSSSGLANFTKQFLLEIIWLKLNSFFIQEHIIKDKLKERDREKERVREKEKKKEREKDKEQAKEKDKEREKKKHKLMNEIKQENGEAKPLLKGEPQARGQRFTHTHLGYRYTRCRVCKFIPSWAGMNLWNV